MKTASLMWMLCVWRTGKCTLFKCAADCLNWYVHHELSCSRTLQKMFQIMNLEKFGPLVFCLFWLLFCWFKDLFLLKIILFHGGELQASGKYLGFTWLQWCFAICSNGGGRRVVQTALFWVCLWHSIKSRLRSQHLCTIQTSCGECHDQIETSFVKEGAQAPWRNSSWPKFNCNKGLYAPTSFSL